MQTLEEQFNTRLSGFLGSTGLRPTTLGMRAVGDPNLLRQIERGRSPSLRTADRILAFIGTYELDSGGARATPGSGRGPTPTRSTVRRKRSGAMTARPSEKRTKPPIRFLRVSEVQARTSLGRSTIYRWSAEGRFPRPIHLSTRVVGWIESDIDEWLGPADHGERERRRVRRPLTLQEKGKGR